MDRLRCMQAFVAVSEHGSFNAAARALDVTSVMVGKYIQQLEQHLGVRLLQRNTRRQALTEAGRDYLAGCRAVLEQVQHIEESASGGQVQPRGVLRVTAPTTWGSSVLTPLVVQFLQVQPQVRVELELGNARVDLIEERFDAAFRMGTIDGAGVIARPLPPYRMQICATPAYLRRHGTPRHPDDLQHHQCLEHLAWRGGQGWKLRGASEAAWPQAPRLASNDGQALREAALAGAGVIMQPEGLLARDIASGALVPLLEDWLPPPRPMHLLYLADRFRRPALASFVEFMLQQLAPQPAVLQSPVPASTQSRKDTR